MQELTLLKALIDAIDSYNEKYNITVMDETIEKTKEGSDWAKAYNDAKQFLTTVGPHLTIAHK